jgi:hypothetical protein
VATSTPTSTTTPPASSAVFGTSSRSSQALSIATGGAISTNGTTLEAGLRPSSALKIE